jgi:hypothetical protein
MLRLSAVTVLLALALTPAAAATSQQIGTRRSISIVNVRVVGHAVTARVRIGGWKMFPALIGSRFDRPDGGHWHLYVDDRYIGGTAQFTYTIELPAGLHRLQAELVNNDHSPLRPPVFSHIVRVHVP